jgi:hypothetical protein
MNGDFFYSFESDKFPDYYSDGRIIDFNDYISKQRRTLFLGQNDSVVIEEKKDYSSQNHKDEIPF